MAQSQTAMLLAALLVVILSMGFEVDANLSVGFYKKKCPNVERIVYEEMAEAYQRDKTVAPGVLRMQFHDCFVRGCDASLLLDGPTTEKASIVNAGLHGFEALDEAKAAVEEACPGVVSCADILAFAARDSVVLAGGQGWGVPAGRRDGTISNQAEPIQNLPAPEMKVPQLLEFFKRKGLSAEQMVDLSGSHTIGISHCFFIINRLFTFPSPSHVDPILPKPFLNTLQKKCPTNTSTTALPLDLVSPANFDPQYFANIVQKRGLMTSDQDLINDSRTRPTVYKNLNRDTFNQRFGQAMVALSEVGVLTGNAGQIRKQCRFVN